MEERRVASERPRLARRLAEGLARGSPDAPRLLLLCGPPGVGKSALLRATVETVRSRRPAAAVVVMTGAGAIDEMVAAVRGSVFDAFRERLLRAELIALDDLHVARGKPRTQVELATILLEAIQRGTRAMCTAGSPHEIPAFVASINASPHARVARMRPPSPEDVRRLLAADAAARGLVLPARRLRTLAAASHGDIGRALGALAQTAFREGEAAPRD